MIDNTLNRVLPWRGLEWDAGPAFHRRWSEFLRSRVADIESALSRARADMFYSDVCPNCRGPRQRSAPRC